MREDDYTRAFGQRLKALRKAAGLTQKELGDKMFMDRTAIQRWERGQRRPHVYNLVLLAGALGCSVEYLATGENVNEGNH